MTIDLEAVPIDSFIITENFIEYTVPFPCISEYPHILNIYSVTFHKLTICYEIRVCLYLLTYLQEVGTFGRF